MKWITHILYGVLIGEYLGVPLSSSLPLSATHTVLTDLLGHRGLRRAPWHGLLSLTLGVLLSAENIIYGTALGLTHILLDFLSPGRLAVSLWYNLPFIAAALFLLGIKFYIAG